jgi:phosphoribosylformylglycinamidine (FGAM) synthase-like amidotransferase family enzyme
MSATCSHPGANQHGEGRFVADDAALGITSPDGRVFGKMGHSERKGDNLYFNVPGEKDQQIFESGVRYFK